MKLTTRSEYALLALVYLARHETDGFISIENIAKAQNIPPKFLEQLMLALKRAHFLRSAKGQHGGYALAKRPAEISLAEATRLHGFEAVFQRSFRRAHPEQNARSSRPLAWPRAGICTMSVFSLAAPCDCLHVRGTGCIARQ